MEAGRLRHRLTLQSQQRVPDGMGGYVEGWADLRQLWAEVTTPSGRVATVAQQLTAVVSAEIRTRPAADLQAGRRLVSKTETYTIQAALPENDLSMVRLLCSSVANP